MLGSRYRGRRKGVAIRDGSVQEARREANLTLAQVAGGTVTRTAIHLIEKGRTRPSLETLQQIARQTHKPIEFFLTPDAPAALTERQRLLRELEQLTALRELQKVIELGSSLLEQRWGAEDLALIHFSIGQAQCRLVRPAEALPHLQFARTEFERLRDEWMAVEAMDWESSALGLLDDPAALPMANSTLERCRRLLPKASQSEARILGHIAGMYVTAHSWAHAIRYYEEAVAAATVVKDLLQMAKMHHGLGAAYQRMQQPAKALQHFTRALSLYSNESDLDAVCRVENDLGCLLLQEGRLDSAEQHLLTALEGSIELTVDRRGRGYILASLGAVMLRRGQLADAQDLLLRSLAAGEATGEKIVQAEAVILLARVEERKGNRTQADSHFGDAIRILEELRMPDRLRDAHMDYAELLDERPDAVAAAGHWKLAAEIGKAAALGLK
ncbi:MAG TPA: tetratricopeptide repeat protein, partial [Candidatus Dormibacteraeota bacterium]|nr:tetratricopeptide repeat protein [Candidatus Dormibacteraeota bacterium]